MGGKRKPIRSDKFDQDVIKLNGLACPFATINSEKDKVANCHVDEGWDSLGDLRQHITRKHGYIYGCSWCGISWTGTKTIKQAEAEIKTHISTCKWRESDRENPQAKHKEQRLTSKQWDQFRKIKNITGEKELAEVYRICGITIPPCYHVKPLASLDTRRSSRPSSSTTRSGLPTTFQPPNRGFLEGFQPPEIQDADTPVPLPSQRITAQRLDQAQRQVQSEHYLFVSGQDAAKDGRDSGYASNSLPVAYAQDESLEFFDAKLGSDSVTYPALYISEEEESKGTDSW